MSDWVRVAALSEIPPGGMLAVKADGEDVALYNVAGTLHATRDCCSHQSYPLSKGALRGKYVRCPLHGWEFDVTSGQYQGNPGIRVRRFPVRVEGEDVYVLPEPIPPPAAPPPPSRDEA